MGVSERKLREKSARKNAIIEAAEKVFFSKGIEKASMDEVAKQAELSKGTLYLYFTNKNALYRAILRRAYNTLLDEIKQVNYNGLSGLQSVEATCKAYIKFSEKHPGYFDAILHYENDVIDLQTQEKESVKSIVAGNQVLEIIVAQISRGIQDKSIVSGIDPIKSALVLWGYTTGILQMLKSKSKLFEHYYKISEEQLFETSFKLLIRSIENNNGH